MRHLYLILILMFSALSAGAQEESDNQEADSAAPQIAYPSSSPAAVSESDAFKTIASDGELSVGLLINALGIVVIVAVLGLAAFFILRRGVFRKSFSKAEGKLQIKESRMLGNRQFIMVVEYEDNRILLGVGPGKIDYLTSLNTYRNEYPQVEAESPDFVQ